MFSKFNRDHISLAEEFNEGHLKTVVVTENIYAVCKLIMQD